MVEQRSPWRLSIFPELFWGLVGLVLSFFKTLGSQEAAQAYADPRSSRRVRGVTNAPPDHRPGGGGGGGGGAGGRRLGGSQGVTGMDSIRRMNASAPGGA